MPNPFARLELDTDDVGQGGRRRHAEGHAERAEMCRLT